MDDITRTNLDNLRSEDKELQIDPLRYYSKSLEWLRCR